MGLQFGCDLRQLVGAAGDENQVVMVASEKLGEFVSDAAGGAGDEYGNIGYILGGIYGAVPTWGSLSGRSQRNISGGVHFLAGFSATLPPFPRSLGPMEVCMSFRSVFIAVVIAFALILAAFLINRARPKAETDQPGAEFVRASGKCAECHSRLQYSVVHEYEMSKHAQKSVNCLDCHQPAQGQEKKIITDS